MTPTYFRVDVERHSPRYGWQPLATPIVLANDMEQARKIAEMRVRSANHVTRPTRTVSCAIVPSALAAYLGLGGGF